MRSLIGDATTLFDRTDEDLHAIFSRSVGGYSEWLLKLANMIRIEEAPVALPDWLDNDFLL